ncbi:MAG: hypothetical protein HYW25_04940 [Candidatus Aenigmarchaeota archaeon]|nr:hypothetical protein [Candidatus Aenigmarchaeota archaeon]
MEVKYIDVPEPTSTLGTRSLMLAVYIMERCRNGRRTTDHLLAAAQNLRLAREEGLDIYPKDERFLRLAERYLNGNGTHQ